MRRHTSKSLPVSSHLHTAYLASILTLVTPIPLSPNTNPKRLEPQASSHRNPTFRNPSTPILSAKSVLEGRWTVVYETDVLLSSVKSTRWEVMVGVGGRLWHLTVHWG
ncbi:hypothetical protein BC829DRAFT_422669 [Chytridium lagenaria]|nr:hypothetical protein BC829DRAFT_422669 [Chytridium lagenaria]